MLLHRRSNARLLPYLHILACVLFFSIIAFYFASSTPYITDLFSESAATMNDTIIFAVPSFAGAISGLIARELSFFDTGFSQAENKRNEMIVRLIGGISAELTVLVIFVNRMIFLGFPKDYHLVQFGLFFLIPQIFNIIFGFIAATATSEEIHIIFWLKAVLFFGVVLFFIYSSYPLYICVFLPCIIFGLGAKYMKRAFAHRGHNNFLGILILIASCWFGIGLGAFLKLGKMSLFSYVSLFGLGGFLLVVFAIDIFRYWKRHSDSDLRNY